MYTSYLFFRSDQGFNSATDSFASHSFEKREFRHSSSLKKPGSFPEPHSEEAHLYGLFTNLARKERVAQMWLFPVFSP